MFDPFVGRRTLTPEQWKARGDAIRARLEGLSIDELMRGSHGAGAPHAGAHGQRRGGYDPNQPRVPAGHSDGGEWTDDEGWTGHPLVRARFAASRELPPLHPRRLVQYLARKVIDAVRRELMSRDLFGEHDDITVSVSTIDGRDIYGTNSGSADWRAIDYAEARRLRAVLVQKYPHSAGGRALGQMPLNALFHSETNLLLRAARANGGSLAGRTLEVFVDGRTCNNCEKILGHVARELGNPTVSFTNIRNGRVIGIVSDGRWRRP
jgi:hypothetical protein